LLAEIASLAREGRAGLALCPADGCDTDTLIAGARAAADIAPPGGVGIASDAATEHVVGEQRFIIADPAMLRVFELVRRLAPTALAVLVQGETGAGKENVALALHHWSSRTNKPMVTLNCAALPDNLVESELFGYEPGAFSDAKTSKPGLIEKANGGTLFLDEIGELSERAQAKLLRVLEQKRTMRLGDVRERNVEVRIVAATNRDLEAECREKRFREDLYFRLSVATVSLPLRQRPREVPLLARRFFTEYARKLDRPEATLSDALLQKLSTYSFPGNVRELKNAMEFAAATFSGARAEISDLPERIRRSIEPEADVTSFSDEKSNPPPAAKLGATPLSEELRRIEVSRIKEALEAAGGVQIRAAELLGMPIRTLVYKLKQYDLHSKAEKRRP
jgi:two-component system response regulator AtoC